MISYIENLSGQKCFSKLRRLKKYIQARLLIQALETDHASFGADWIYKQKDWKRQHWCFLYYGEDQSISRNGKKSVSSEMVGWNHQLDGHKFEQATRREACHAAVHGVTKSLTRLSNWTEWEKEFEEVILLVSSPWFRDPGLAASQFSLLIVLSWDATMSFL